MHLPISIFTEPLQKAHLLERSNRFIAKVELEDTQEIVNVHVPSTGRLDTVLRAGQLCYLKHSNNPRRKTAYSLYHVEAPHSFVTDKKSLVCIDSLLANQFVKQLLASGAIEGIPTGEVRAEVSFGKDRLDFVAYDINSSSQLMHLIEVKSVNMAINGVACFPDAPTERGQKHLRSLIAKQGETHYQTHVVFVIQRNDVRCFQACHDRDPAFSQLLSAAEQAGTKIHVCLTDVTESRIIFDKWLPYRG